MRNSKYLIELVYLYFGMQLAIFLRVILPFGQTVFNWPSTTPNALFLLFMIWGSIRILGFLFQEKLPKRLHHFLPFLLAITIGIAEYILLGLTNESFSRLFLIYLVATSTFGVIAASRTDSFLQRHKAELVDVLVESKKIYDSINAFLYRYKAELIVAISFALIWGNYLLKMGLTIVSDSIEYMSVAQRANSISELFQLIKTPPVYPIALRLVKVFAPFPADGAAIISAAALIIFAFVFAVILRKFSRHSLINIVMIFLLMSYEGFLNIFINSLSEQIYLTFFIAFYFFIVKHWSSPKWMLFLGAALMAGLAMLTRIIGLTIGIMLLFYAFILSEPKNTFSYRLRKYSLPVAGAFIILLSAVFIFNLFNQGNAFTPNQVNLFAYSFPYSPSDILDSFEKRLWSMTEGTVSAFWNSAGAAYMLVALTFVILLFTSLRRSLNEEHRELLGFNLIFLTGNFILMIVAFILVNGVPRERYWMQLYPLVLIVVPLTVDIFFQKKRFGKSLADIALLAIFLLTLFYTAFMRVDGFLDIIVRRPIKSSATPLHQTYEGFNLSPTSYEFRAFFENISEYSDSNTIIVVDGDYNYNKELFETDQNVARAFLFKSSMIDAPSLSMFRFFDIGHRQLSLEYYLEGNRKVLKFYYPNTLEIEETIRHAKESAQVIVAENQPGYFVIVNQQILTTPSEIELGDYLGAFQTFANIPPFIVFKLP